jgi:hypothetical protein
MSTNTLTLGQVEARNVIRAIGIDIPADTAKRTRLHHRMVDSWGRNPDNEWTPGQGVCKVCAKRFCPAGEDIVTVELFGEPMTIPVPVCEECSPLVSDHYRQRDEDGSQDATATPQWDEMCPLRFKEAIAMPSLPPRIDRAAFGRVEGWKGGSRGLYVFGPTGTGKTTAFWALARLLEQDGTKPVILRAIELGRQLSTAARDLKDVQHLCRCRVLMIDDLGKEKANPAMSSLLSEVFDARYGDRLPVIVTTRFSSEELRDRFAEPSIGEDICRRLFELCDGVTFEVAK